MWLWLQFLLFLTTVSVCLSLPKDSGNVERSGNMKRNFNMDNLLDCWRDSIEKPSKESDESLSQEELSEDNHLQGVRDQGRKINRTLYTKESVNRVGRNDRKRKKYLLLSTAAISAIAASTSTAVTILLPLALKLITFLAIKSFFVGTIAILMTSFLGFFRMVQEPAEKKTVIYVNKRPHNDFHQRNIPYGNFWSDTQDVEGTY